MDFKKGDIISAPNINAGEFQGFIETTVGNETITMAKIVENDKRIVHYLPESKISSLKKLPSKKYLTKQLVFFDNDFKINLPKEFEVSRYEYFKESSKENGILSFFETLRSMMILNKSKDLTLAEKKLLNNYKEKFYADVISVLGWSKQEASAYLQASV